MLAGALGTITYTQGIQASNHGEAPMNERNVGPPQYHIFEAYWTGTPTQPPSYDTLNEAPTPYNIHDEPPTYQSQSELLNNVNESPTYQTQSQSELLNNEQ